MDSLKKYILLSLCFASLGFTSSLKAQFTPGNFVVIQAGTGTGSLSGNGNPVFLKEYTPGGSTGYSMTVPSTGTNALIIAGNATSEGMLTLSSNGKYLVLAGYNAPATNTTPLAASASSVINRAISTVDMNGNYSLAAVSNTFYSAGNIRGGISDGIGNFWSAGSNQGTNYFGNVSTPTTVQSVTVNTRAIQTFSNNMYLSTGSGTPGIYQIGSGMPVVSGQTLTPVIVTAGTGTGTASPYAFYFNATQTVCYVADDRTPANGGGIQKWVNSGSWTLAYTINTGAAGARGIVASFTGTTPVLFFTTAEATANKVCIVNDLGAGSTPTAIVTASANTIFRGIALAPTCAVPSVTAITQATCNTNGSITLSSNYSGTGPATFSWTGSGTITSPGTSVTSVSGTSNNASYTLNVSNGCGTASSVVSASLNSVPGLTLSASASSICAGESATLTANSNGTAVIWSNGVNGMVNAISPTVTTVYTASTSNECGIMTQTLSLEVNNCTGLQDLSHFNNEMIQVYPNPCHEKLIVDVANHQEVLVEIRDLYGKLLVIEKSLNGKSELQTADLEKGLYFVTVSSGKDRVTHKFVKE